MARLEQCIEKFIYGVELAVSIIGKSSPQILPIVEIVPKKDFFDFESRLSTCQFDTWPLW